MQKYGVPYQGSKNKIAEWVVSQLPSGRVLVDLFAGGCAVTHCAILAGRWDSYIANDICDAPQLFIDAVNGKYKDERRWISREDFFRLKDTDPYVRYCWSFGNGADSYLYGELGIEQVKKAMHEICFAETPQARRLALRGLYNAFKWVDEEASRMCVVVTELCEKNDVECIRRPDGTPDAAALYRTLHTKMTSEVRQYLRDALTQSGLTQADVDRHLGNQMSGHYFGASQWALPTAEHYAKMQQILPALTKEWANLNESLESLQRLERLQSLQRLETSRADYRAVQIPAGAVVYCDPPYKGTAGYNGTEFDHAAFYEWLLSRDFPVYVSEYYMPDDFAVVAEHPKACTMSATSIKQTTERLYVQRRFADMIFKPDRGPLQLTLFDIAI